MKPTTSNFLIYVLLSIEVSKYPNIVLSSNITITIEDGFSKWNEIIKAAIH